MSGHMSDMGEGKEGTLLFERVVEATYSTNDESDVTTSGDCEESGGNGTSCALGAHEQEEGSQRGDGSTLGTVHPRDRV